jgi:metallo-beta-lactamase family protein
MMECTYGDTRHDDPELSHREFAEVVKRTIMRGGKIIIPAFAVGRTQDLVFSLNQLISDNFIPPIPVYVDSPLAVQASQVFIKHPECYDSETHTFIREERHPALTFPGLSYVRSVEDSKAINFMKGPLIIISASGMAETGRILHHLKNNIGDSENTVLLVSWQAPDTLGRRLADGMKVVRIFGEEYPVRARVIKIGGLSAHAGQDMLVKYAGAVKGRLKGIFLVHGEPDAETVLRTKLVDLGITGIHYPDLHEKVEMES